MLNLSQIYGMPIVEEPLMADKVYEQVKFPRSKKKRIRKKWSKNKKNYRLRVIPWNKVYELNNVLYAHPHIVKLLKEQLANKW